MQFLAVLPALLSAVIVSGRSASTFESLGSLCAGAPVISESFIGVNKDVKVTNLDCSPPDLLIPRASADPVDVCRAPCDTHCFTPSGGGPNPNDCKVIADALMFQTQSSEGHFFTVSNNVTGKANTITASYNSCKTFFLNQANVPLKYCRDEWSKLVNYLAFNCQATQNAHGGLCVAKDGKWFVQVQS